MKDILMEAFISLGKIRAAIESKEIDGEKLGLIHFVDEPAIIADIIADLHMAYCIIK